MKLRNLAVAKSIASLVGTAAFLFGIQTLVASPASPFAFEEEQPDGSHIDLHIDGDEFFHRLHDTNGYTVLQDRGWFVFAEKGKNG